MSANLKITLSLPVPLIKELRKAAERDRRTMSSVTALALEHYLQGSGRLEVPSK